MTKVRTDGHIQKRGRNSYRIKFDLGRDPVTGKRRTQYITVRGRKKDAQEKLTELMRERDTGSFVNPSRLTLKEFADWWLKEVAPSKTSPKTFERYSEIIENNILPVLGAIRLQSLDAGMIDSFYGKLRTSGRLDGKGGLAPQTIIHIHRLLSQIIRSALRKKKLKHNPMDGVEMVPKAPDREIQILEDTELTTLLARLKGKSLYGPVMLAASTGLRRGEVLGLKWPDIDLDAAKLSVSRVVEQTKGRIRLKEPKTPHSRRTITLPPIVVEVLRQHKKAQAARRLKLGLGKDPHALVFATFDGHIRSPRAFSKEFSMAAKAAGVQHVTFHGLRHTHISTLLREGVPITTVSKRAGHKNPNVTLAIYAHVMQGMDQEAADRMEEVLRGILGG